MEREVEEMIKRSTENLRRASEQVEMIKQLVRCFGLYVRDTSRLVDSLDDPTGEQLAALADMRERLEDLKAIMGEGWIRELDDE